MLIGWLVVLRNYQHIGAPGGGLNCCMVGAGKAHIVSEAHKKKVAWYGGSLASVFAF